MRENFNRFWDFICIVSIICALNINYWPCASVTIYNKYFKCETSLTSERNESYRAMIDSVIDCSLLRTRDQRYAVAVDGAINQSIYII